MGMNPISNPVTEKRCQKIAEMYKTDKEEAGIMYHNLIRDEVNWVKLAISDRINFLVRKQRE